VELVAEMRRERRNALLLAVAGVAILFILAVLYFTMVDAGDLRSHRARSRAPSCRWRSRPPRASSARSRGETAGAARAQLGRVTIILPAKSSLWIDGKSLGKVKEHVAELSPGAHELKTKVARRRSCRASRSSPAKLRRFGSTQAQEEDEEDEVTALSPTSGGSTRG